MKFIALTIVLLMAAFAAGVKYSQYSDSRIAEYRTRIADLNQQLSESKLKIENLRETLQLIKRQLQTDRLAYQTLQQSVIDSEQQRLELQATLKQQKERLQNLQ